jgi:hypothetical protein
MIGLQKTQPSPFFHASDACGHVNFRIDLLLSTSSISKVQVCISFLCRLTASPPSWLSMPRPVQGQQQGASRAQPSKQQQRRRQQQQTISTNGEDECADEVPDCDDSGSSESDFQPSKKPRST